MNYFNFVPVNKILSYRGELLVKLFYDVADRYVENLRVRPVVGSGIAFIYDDINEKWVSQFDVMTNLPIISKDLKVKILNVANDTVDLWFDVVDMKQQKVTSTPKVSLFSHEVVSKEIQKLNSGVLLQSTVSREPIESTTSEEYYEYQPIPPQAPADKNFAIIVAAVFVLFLILGILYQLRMVKWVDAKKFFKTKS